MRPLPRYKTPGQMRVRPRPGRYLPPLKTLQTDGSHFFKKSPSFQANTVTRAGIRTYSAAALIQVCGSTSAPALLLSLIHI